MFTTTWRAARRCFRILGGAIRLVELLAKVKARDGWTAFAWCVMSSHYLCAAAHKKCYVERSVMWS